MLAGLASTASAEVLLTADLSVQNQLTLNATDGLSAATLAFADNRGVNFQGFGGDTFTIKTGAGPITTANDSFQTGPATPDGTPQVSYTSTDSLSLYNFTADDTNYLYQAQQAFLGSATFALSSSEYDALLASDRAGDLYVNLFNGDYTNANLIGQYQVTVPEPASLLLLTAAGLPLLTRRRQQH